MSLLNQIDELVDFIDENKDFDIRELEDNILYHIFAFLIDEAPLEDGLVLTCKKFRFTTYNHPIKFPQHYHVRIDPIFRFTKQRIKDDTLFQIGAPIAPATKQAIVINNINGILNNKIFPFHNMRVFQFTAECSLSIAQPLFKILKSSFKYLSFASCHFLSQNVSDDIKEDFPPIFENCSLFTLICAYARTWNKSINLNGKFPQLTALKLSIENIDVIPQLQRFLDSVSNTVSMLFMELNIRSKDYDNYENNNESLFTLKLPPNLEILSIYCAEDMNYNIDVSACTNLKYFIALRSSVKYVHNSIHVLPNLKYLVVNGLNDVYNIEWDLCKANGIKTIYLPSLPSFSKKIQGTGDIILYGHFPNVNQVKNDIENKKLRLLLRDLNNQQKRHYLWGYFWYAGWKQRDKLKYEEIQLIKQDSME